MVACLVFENGKNNYLWTFGYEKIDYHPDAPFSSGRF